jgi:hypothetical protein
MKTLLALLTIIPFYTHTMEQRAPQDVIREARHNLITLATGLISGTSFNLQNQNFFIQNVGGASFSYLAYLAINYFAEMREGQPFNINANIFQFREQEALLLVAYTCTVLSVTALRYMLSRTHTSTH